MNAVVLVAGGSGSRLNSDINKPYLAISGKKVISYSLERFLNTDFIDLIVIVYRSNDEVILNNLLKNNYVNQNNDYAKKIITVLGGNERYDSVFNGLKAIQSYDIKKVFIHDAARPFVSFDLLQLLNDTAKLHKAVIPVYKPPETVKIVDNNDFVNKTLNREFIRLVQTPQVFDYESLLKLYSSVSDWSSITDDAMIFEKFNYKVKTVVGSLYNIKITTNDDLKIAEFISELWN